MKFFPKALALVFPVLVCGETNAVSDAISIDESHPRLKPGLTSPPFPPPLENNIQDHGNGGGGRMVELEQHLTIPVPPVPGSDATLSHEVWHHYQQQQQENLQLSSLPQLRHSPTGTFPNLVLLLRFSDHTSRELPSQADISRLYNSEETGTSDDVTPTGSVRQVFFSNSHSIFTVETTVIDWITLPNTEHYYASGEFGLSKSKFKEAIAEALTILDTNPQQKTEYSNFDFDAFDLDDNGALDGFGVLHSGYGAEFSGNDCYGAANKERIWSHKGGFEWTSTREGGVTANRYYVSSALRGKCNSKIVRMGVLCHELGHYLGLPDLYDTTFEGNGLGGYDFMSRSWGWDGTGLYPSNLSAWSKLELGWATADLIESDGTYELEAATALGIKVYKITNNFPEGEYLLLENRQPIGYDSKMEEGGIAIYHVDERVRGQRKCGYPSQPDWPQNGNHYEVALVAANGKYDLEQGANQGDEGDLWHAGSKLAELGPGPNTFPNTDFYQKKKVGQTGIRIYGFSVNGNIMTFSVEGLTKKMEEPTQPPSHVPRTKYSTGQPTRAKAQKKSPNHVPTGEGVVSSLARN
mmetsp:Transcript_25905/g.47627  ORF Transcript_25905/g.47627 Transcript_25905/m.47627 type:complete len:580 (-) Transcript_25905:140-1879(-)